MRDPSNLIIAALAVAVAVLAYLYFTERREGARIEAPGVKIETQ